MACRTVHCRHLCDPKSHHVALRYDKTPYSSHDIAEDAGIRLAKKNWSPELSVDKTMPGPLFSFFHCRTRKFNVFIVFSSVVKCCQHWRSGNWNCGWWWWPAHLARFNNFTGMNDDERLSARCAEDPLRHSPCSLFETCQKLRRVLEHL